MNIGQHVNKLSLCLVFSAHCSQSSSHIISLLSSTGCSLICVYSKKYFNIPDSGLSLFSLGVSVCTHTRQLEHQRCSRNGRVQKNHNILRKTTIFNEHPVLILLYGSMTSLWPGLSVVGGGGWLDGHNFLKGRGHFRPPIGALAYFLVYKGHTFDNKNDIASNGL